MRSLRFLRQARGRWLVAVLVAVIALGTSVAATAAVTGGVHHKMDTAAGARAAGTRAAANASTAPSEFSTTANPVSLDAPVRVPHTRPVVVTVADNAQFGNGPAPYQSTVSLPKGDWSMVVLDVTGTETGRQYDRLAEVYDGATQIFLGVTPEPTPAGITWHVQKDITGYLPLLSGTRTFSSYIDNYLNSVDTGIPALTVKLYFYPAGGGYRPAQVATTDDPGLAGDAINQTGPAS